MITFRIVIEETAPNKLTLVGVAMGHGTETELSMVKALSEKIGQVQEEFSKARGWNLPGGQADVNIPLNRG